jgi:hypothetical protein
MPHLRTRTYRQQAENSLREKLQVSVPQLLRSRHSHMSGAPLHDKIKLQKRNQKPDTPKQLPPNPTNNATIRAFKEGGRQLGTCYRVANELGPTC